MDAEDAHPPESRPPTLEDLLAIPFASPKLLLRMKQTYREKDALDRQFLEQKIREMEINQPGQP